MKKLLAALFVPALFATSTFADDDADYQTDMASKMFLARNTAAIDRILENFSANCAPLASKEATEAPLVTYFTILENGKLDSIRISNPDLASCSEAMLLSPDIHFDGVDAGGMKIKSSLMVISE